MQERAGAARQQILLDMEAGDQASSAVKLHDDRLVVRRRDTERGKQALNDGSPPSERRPTKPPAERASIAPSYLDPFMKVARQRSVALVAVREGCAAAATCASCRSPIRRCGARRASFRRLLQTISYVPDDAAPAAPPRPARPPRPLCRTPPRREIESVPGTPVKRARRRPEAALRLSPTSTAGRAAIPVRPVTVSSSRKPARRRPTRRWRSSTAFSASPPTISPNTPRSWPSSSMPALCDLRA